MKDSSDRAQPRDGSLNVGGLVIDRAGEVYENKGLIRAMRVRPEVRVYHCKLFILKDYPGNTQMRAKWLCYHRDRGKMTKM